MIEILFSIKKDQFKAYPAIQSNLDFVDENYGYTHMITLDDLCEPQEILSNKEFFNEIFYFFLCFFQMHFNMMTNMKKMNTNIKKFETKFLFRDIMIMKVMEIKEEEEADVVENDIC